MLCGPYLDNRIGCVTLLLAMEQLAEAETENDLYFVFTSQEEVGLRGAGAAAFSVEPDIAIAVDVTDTGDLPERKTPMAVDMGKGPAVKVMDRSVICHPQLVETLERLAGEREVPVSGTSCGAAAPDAGAIHTTRMGVLTGGVSRPLPVYPHPHGDGLTWGTQRPA